MFVRNGARSVRRAVDSVLAQTYPNIEFVVQDGASTDGTLDILRSYGERIKLRWRDGVLIPLHPSGTIGSENRAVTCRTC